jgi:hypothetical protein
MMLVTEAITASIYDVLHKVSYKRGEVRFRPPPTPQW